MSAQLLVGGRAVRIDLSRPIDLALPLDPHGAQPRHFGAPAAHAEPLQLGGFSGAVSRGASCNCEVITLIPHCNGTHTECVGHLTREPLNAYQTVPPGLVAALLVSVQPQSAQDAQESTDPAPAAQDLLITRAALQRAWPAQPVLTPRALILRTLPNSSSKRVRDYSGSSAPYLSREAAALLIERGIEHLVVDLPSLDREHDAGRLTAHRIFFGLPVGVSALAAARRPSATVTELAFIPDSVPDGTYLLELQVPALAGDAVPSRPLLYALAEAPAHA